MTSPLNPPLDLDQVAAVLAGLRPGWRDQGLAVRPFLWRDARGSWPQILHTDRGNVAEPESVGLTLTAADGREARLVIWRGGWADAGLLADDTISTRTPAVRDLAGCAALATWMASELTAPRPEQDDWLDLRPVTIVWVSDWWDGPVEGMATYQGRDCWFRAIFDTGADEWTSPRRCRLYELAEDERQRLWARHRLWEQDAGGGSCYHPDAPDPAVKPGSQDFYQHADRQPARTGAQIGEFTAPPMQPPDGTPAPRPRTARAGQEKEEEP
jgi:hypothetical protein